MYNFFVRDVEFARTAQMLDHIPSELSAAGAKRGVRSVPSRCALGSSKDPSFGNFWKLMAPYGNLWY